MSSPTQLRQQRFDIVKKMGELLTLGTPAALAQRKELDDKQESLRVEIETTERRLGYNLPNVGNNSGEFGADGDDSLLARTTAVLDAPEYRKSFRKAFFGRHIDPMEARALSTTGDGQTLIPIGFQKEIATYMKMWGGLRYCSRVVTTSTGNELQWPTLSDTSNGEQSGTWNAGQWVPESESTSESEPTFSNVTLYTDLIDSGLCLVPVQLMQDADFSVEGVLAEVFGRRIGRGTAQAYQNGNSERITGLLTTLTTNPGTTGGNKVLALGANANSGNSADDEINSIGSADFSNLISAVDPAYRNSPKAAFLANQATYDKFRGQLDKYGRPLWSVSLVGGEPDKIYGYPYFIDQSLPTIGAGATGVVIFGDFAQYIVRDALGMTMVRYNELFMQNHQIGFQAYMRTFGACLIPPAFSYLQYSLS